MIHYMTANGIGNAWVANELSRVLAAGVPVRLHAMRKPQATFHASQWAAKLDQQTTALYPLPVLGLLWSVMVAPLLFGTRFWAALGNALFAPREHLRARVAALAHFFVACHWARSLKGQQVSLIHSQWIHSNGTIAMYGSWLLGVPFSFTGHAADLFRDRVALLDKIRRAAFIICISEFHRRFYIDLGADPAKLHIVYCGIDVSHFAPPPADDADRAERPLHVISSGRLVDKKGFADLIDAMALLKQRDLHVRCTIAGSGPLDRELRQRITDLRLSDCIHMTGKAIKQEEIPAFMHGGDVYALPCVWAADRDVDGLPQMLMEAMACGRPVVSTRLVGIPDLIIDGQTGLLIEPGNVRELADAVHHLLADRDLADRLAAAGRQRVLEAFNLDHCLEPLIALFRSYLPAAAPAAPTLGVRPNPAQLEAVARP